MHPKHSCTPSWSVQISRHEENLTYINFWLVEPQVGYIRSTVSFYITYDKPIVVDLFLYVSPTISKEYRAKYAKFIKKKTIMRLWGAITAGLFVRAFLFFGKNPHHFSR